MLALLCHLYPFPHELTSVIPPPSPSPTPQDLHYSQFILPPPCLLERSPLPNISSTYHLLPSPPETLFVPNMLARHQRRREAYSGSIQTARLLIVENESHSVKSCPSVPSTPIQPELTCGVNYTPIYQCQCKGKKIKTHQTCSFFY
jgi:hypothetical protein